jgi:hypothetical protein
VWEAEAGSVVGAVPWRGLVRGCDDGVPRDWERCGSANDGAVSVGGYRDDAGGDHSGEAFVEGSGTNAAGRAQVGEWPWLAGVGENRGDALIDGLLMDGAIGLGIGLEQREGVIALGKFERDAGDGRGGAMLDGERDAIVVSRRR